MLEFLGFDGVVGGAGEGVRVVCSVCRGLGRWLSRGRCGSAGAPLGVVVFCDEERGFEYACLNCLHLDCRGEGGGVCLVDFQEGGVQFTAYGHPFRGFEVVVLEEEHERGGAQQGAVLPVEL